MTKDERNEAVKKGLEVLRSRFDSRTERWQVAKYTSSGGWSRFGGKCFLMRSDSDAHIKWLVASYPYQYVNDNE